MLYIAEKKSVAIKISKSLGKYKLAKGFIQGDDFVVTWCLGHLLEPFMPSDYDAFLKKWDLSNLPIVPHTWKLKSIESKSYQLKVVLSLINSSNIVINAGDADREGQLIVDELLHYSNYDGKVLRLWITDSTPSGISDAIKNISSNNSFLGLYNSALVRQHSDWLFGLNLTQAYTLFAKKFGFNGVLNIGRVQTPTLNLVFQRDNLIKDFVPYKYYDVSCLFGFGDSDFKSSLFLDDSLLNEKKLLTNKNLADDCLNTIVSDFGVVDSLQSKFISKHQPLCYNLTQLQAEASKRFSFSLTKTLDIAQKLYDDYELITYPRSDCQYLSSNDKDKSKSIVASLNCCGLFDDFIGDIDLSIKSKTWNDKKVSLSSHTAIIPTGSLDYLNMLTQDELILFTLICKRYLLQFFHTFDYDEIKFKVLIDGLEFFSKSRKVINKGWMVFNSIKDFDCIDVSDGDKVSLQSKEIFTKVAKPPSYFTEGTLALAMENVSRGVDDKSQKITLKACGGLGTSATRAAIVDKLKDSGFLCVNEKFLNCSKRGSLLLNCLSSSIKSPVITSTWEQKLLLIEGNKFSSDEFLSDLVSYVDNEIRNASSIDFSNLSNLVKCPSCDKGFLNKINGKFGFFWGCSNYLAGCKAIFKNNKGKPVLKTSKKPPVSLTHECPLFNCDGILTQYTRKDKKSKFWICDNCASEGRNKFFNDLNNLPFPQ